LKDTGQPANVLVGIVTHNRAALLPKAIRSALAQQCASNTHIAVLDDGSTDGTDGVRRHFPGVSWTRWDQNRGLIAARNFLMESSGEEFFVSLDDDAWFMSGDEIAIALRHFVDNPKLAGVGFDILSPDRSQVCARTSPEPAAMFIGCGHVLRLTCAREVGLYESSPGIYGGEEKDLCLRLMNAGYRIDRLPGVHVWHDKTPVARHIPDQHQSGVCNDLVMTLRRTPWYLLPAALLAKFYRHWMFSWKNELIAPCLEGFGLFMRSLPEVWRSRKPVRSATLRAYMQLTRS